MIKIRKKKKHKTSTKVRIRQTVQLVLFGFFLLTVLQATYPFNPWLPPELFLWMDPLAGITTMLAARTFLPWFLLGGAVLLLTVVLGRSFCGWVCPLGTMVDMADRLWAPKNQGRIKRKTLRPLKTWLLVFFLLGALAGVQFVWIFDPIPLTWRTFGAFIFPGLTMLLNGSFDLLLKWGADWDWLYESYDWVSFNVVPLDTHVVTGWIVVAVMFATILGLSAISRRFWCRRLCPLGALLGLAGKFSLLQRVVVEDTCTECGLCSKRCKMGAIEDDFTTTEKAECILCLNCADDCKKGKTIYTFRKPTNQVSTPDLGRRSAIGTVAGGVGAGVAVHFLDPTETRSQWLIRPPGAQEEPEFLDRCIRCNECVRICSMTGQCLQPLHFEEGVQAFWTPVADFSNGYCEYSCNLCGQICPTEAILPLPLEVKKTTKMGVAEIYQDLCIPYKDKINCIVCEEHCPTAPKAIEFREKVRPIEEGDGAVDRAAGSGLTEPATQTAQADASSDGVARGDGEAQRDGVTRELAPGSQDPYGSSDSEGYGGGSDPYASSGGSGSDPYSGGGDSASSGGDPDGGGSDPYGAGGGSDPYGNYENSVANRTYLEPFVRTGRCIGCGICEEKCPVEGHKAIRVVRRLEERGEKKGEFLHDEL